MAAQGNTVTPISEIPGMWARAKGAWNAAVDAARSAFWSPGAPIPPVAPEIAIEPRVRDFTPGQNQSTTPRGDEKALTPFAQLRSLAASYDIAGICINFLQQELGALDWKIMPVDADDRTATQRLASNIKRVTEKLKYPDGDQLLDQWVTMLLAEDLEIGAPVVYKHKTRGGGLGPLEIVQGDTIKPILDIRGKTASYQQIWHGVPLGLYSPTDMLYVPRMRRRGSAYGIAPLERVLIAANTALRRQNFELSYFTEGNIPEIMMAAPEGWSPEQIAQFQEWFDALLVGNDSMRRRLRMVPTDPSKSLHVKQLSETTEPQLWLLKVCCAAYNVRPGEIGFAADVNRATMEGQENSQERVGVFPLAKWVEDIFTRIIQQDMREPELRFSYDLGGKVDDRYQRAQTDEINIRSGIYSAAYARNRDGIDLDPNDPLLQQESAPAEEDLGAPVVDDGQEDIAAPVEDGTGGEEGGNVLTLALAVGELEKDGPTTGRKTGPGSRGGKYWIDAKGHVRYGAKPASAGVKESKAKATEQRRAQRQQLAEQRKADQAKKKAEREKAKEERHQLAVGKANARDELKGTNDLRDMRAKGWATDKDEGYGEDKASANDAARQAGLKDKGSIYAVVKVNGEYYVVSKPLKDLQAERTKNTVSGGSHKTKEEDAKRDLEGGDKGGSSGGGGGGGRGAVASAARIGDLRKWQDKAIGRLRGGRGANCSFESEAIDATLMGKIRAGLAVAETPAAVKAVFSPFIVQNGG